MRIAFVVTLPELAEYDDTTGLLADALVRRGHDVTIAGGERPPWYLGGRLAEWVDAIGEGGHDVVVKSPPQVLIVENDVYRDKPARESDPLRALLFGAAEGEARAIDDGYGAVAHARWFHQKVHLVRASPWAPSRSEPLDDVQEFHVGLDDAETIRLLHACDVVLVPSPGEPSLIAAAAMASSIPCVVRVPNESATDLGERLIEVLQDDELREDMRTRGREMAKEWRADLVAERFESTLLPSS